MRFRAFPERVGPRILLLESVDYFRTSELQCQKKKNLKGAVSRNSAKLGNYKMPFKLGET